MLKNNLFKWNPTKNAYLSISIGFIIIILSLLMNLLRQYYILSVFIRDILMILFFGIFIPLFFIKKENKFNEYGLSFNKFYIHLPINFILAINLLILFLSKSQFQLNFSLTKESLSKIIYIMLTGIFEVIFFYSFMRKSLENSFGIIVSLILTALFYSFHHAGFQPEFTKLFFVGILYALIFRIGNSFLLIYPFFWGVGACYDVLIQSKSVSTIFYVEIRSLILLIGIILIFLSLSLLNKHIESKDQGI